MYHLQINIDIGDLAAWVQAIGSVVALVISIWIYVASQRKELAFRISADLMQRQDRRIQQWVHARKLVLTRQTDLNLLEQSLRKIEAGASSALAGATWEPIELLGLNALENQIPDAIHLRSDRADAYLGLIYICRHLEVRIANLAAADWFAITEPELTAIKNLANASLKALETVSDTFRRIQKNGIPTVMIYYPPGQQTFDEPY
ncbi:hypothetical protein [Stagnimonas aquatica]|uniref:hypothetical protein n=1 Tax=Stagnimonas aquatica TaxID=2689987 RepID=UPI0011CE6444|nr:hypothetical protein [Stagnimonas aquatica]